MYLRIDILTGCIENKRLSHVTAFIQQRTYPHIRKMAYFRIAFTLRVQGLGSYSNGGTVQYYSIVPRNNWALIATRIVRMDINTAPIAGERRILQFASTSVARGWDGDDGETSNLGILLAGRTAYHNATLRKA